jgi:hypothetical protein
MKHNNRQGLEPRVEDVYPLLLFWRFLLARPGVAIIAAVILVLVLSVIFYFITVDAAHMAGVTSYGG